MSEPVAYDSLSVEQRMKLFRVYTVVMYVGLLIDLGFVVLTTITTRSWLVRSSLITIWRSRMN